MKNGHTATLRTPAPLLFVSLFGSPVETPALSFLITDNFLITFLITLGGIVTFFLSPQTQCLCLLRGQAIGKTSTFLRTRLPVRSPPLRCILFVEEGGGSYERGIPNFCPNLSDSSVVESPKVRFLVRRNPPVSNRYGLHGYFAHKKTHLS